MSNKKIIAGLFGAAALAASALIIPFEGKLNIAYLDPPKIPTICYGHTKGVSLGQTASDDQCLVWLGEDVKEVEKAIDKLVKVKINERYKASLISFTYNVGSGNFAKSTLLKKLNTSDMTGACQQMLRWVYIKGEYSSGLARRRLAEYHMCISGVDG